MSEIREGWQAEKHPSQRVYHYLLSNGRSLCRKLGFYTGEVQTLNPDAPKGREDCSECFRKLKAAR